MVESLRRGPSRLSERRTGTPGGLAQHDSQDRELRMVQAEAQTTRMGSTEANGMGSLLPCYFRDPTCLSRQVARRSGIVIVLLLDLVVLGNTPHSASQKLPTNVRQLTLLTSFGLGIIVFSHHNFPVSFSLRLSHRLGLLSPILDCLHPHCPNGPEIDEGPSS